jgi:hypothetical protein
VTRTLERDLTERSIERVVPYSDKLFHRTAIQWLTATDQVMCILCLPLIRLSPQPNYSFLQPIQALEHPKFKEMIDVASRATNGVDIPGRKATRGEIIRLFKDHLTNLKAEFAVSIRLISGYLLIISPNFRVQLYREKLA